jgi:glucan 1,6-alpha-glucosidase
MIPLHLPALKECFRSWQQGLHGCGWNSLFLNNHDLPRTVSRWGNPGQYRVESAKMLATMLHGMQGTPYIYQGEELGMTNIRLPIEEYVDIETHNIYRERTEAGYSPDDVMASIYARSRDNARTPIQWTDGENAGFTAGKSWMPINENYKFINARAALEDPDYTFYYYQKLIRLRHELPIIAYGRFEPLLEDSDAIYAYRRIMDDQILLVACNWTAAEQPCALFTPDPAAASSNTLTTAVQNTYAAPPEDLISNYDTHKPGILQPYEARAVLYRIN